MAIKIFLTCLILVCLAHYLIGVFAPRIDGKPWGIFLSLAWLISIAVGMVSGLVWIWS